MSWRILSNRAVRADAPASLRYKGRFRALIHVVATRFRDGLVETQAMRVASAMTNHANADFFVADGDTTPNPVHREFGRTFALSSGVVMSQSGRHFLVT